MNRFVRSFLVVALAGTFALTGCKKDEAPAGGEKAAEGAKAGGEMAAKPAPTPATADAAMKALMEGIQNKKPQAAWDFLPASYQKDVTTLVHEVGGKVDAELYNKAFAVLNKALTLLKTKKEYILKSKLTAQALQNPMLPPGTIEKNWDGVVEIISIITTSELAKSENLKTLDVGKFLSGTGAKLMDKGFEIAKAAGQDPTMALKGFQAEMVKTEGDKATVKLTPPGGGSPSEEQFVKVEGKWIPAEMADEWKQEIERMKGQLGAIPAQMAEAKPMAMPMLTKVEETLDKLNAAKSQEEFDGALLGAVAAFGGPGAGAPPGAMPPPDGAMQGDDMKAADPANP